MLRSAVWPDRVDPCTTAHSHLGSARQSFVSQLRPAKGKRHRSKAAFRPTQRYSLRVNGPWVRATHTGHTRHAIDPWGHRLTHKPMKSSWTLCYNAVLYSKWLKRGVEYGLRQLIRRPPSSARPGIDAARTLGDCRCEVGCYGSRQGGSNACALI